jgi:hypothetical protein
LLTTACFSLAPLLIIAIAIAALFFGETAAQSGVMQQFRPAQAAAQFPPSAPIVFCSTGTNLALC